MIFKKKLQSFYAFFSRSLIEMFAVFNLNGITHPTIAAHGNFLMGFVSNHIIYYGTPVNLTYFWSLAGVSLVVQIISGLFLAMFYTPHVDLAFASIEFIMKDVNNGWLIRYIYSNGASMFFLVVYCHLFRSLYYNSYAQPRELFCISGTILLLLMMATAFLGYVLPWGQMSFWGATVITSMFSAIPKAGKYIVEWLWGGFTVNNPTLNRFFAFHFSLPFLIVGVVFLHLTLLHKEGSSAPLSDSTSVDQISFYPYYFVKDLFALFVFFICLYPNALGDPNNYIMADSIHTPRHIVPEWSFLPFYAILRSIPHKTAGILAMLFSLLVLFVLFFINTSLVKDSSSRLVFKIFYFAAIADFLALGWLGQSPVKDGYIFAGQIATIYYFFFFLVFLPLSGIIKSLITYPLGIYGLKDVIINYYKKIKKWLEQEYSFPKVVILGVATVSIVAVFWLKVDSILIYIETKKLTQSNIGLRATTEGFSVCVANLSHKIDLNWFNTPYINTEIVSNYFEVIGYSTLALGGFVFVKTALSSLPFFLILGALKITPEPALLKPLFFVEKYTTHYAGDIEIAYKVVNSILEIYVRTQSGIEFIPYSLFVQRFGEVIDKFF